jgi:nicotinate-nucleotide adenylyltransferase
VPALGAYPAEHVFFHCIRTPGAYAVHHNCGRITKVLLALELLYGGRGNPRSVAVFPGAWNPPTVAHLEIARAALAQVDEVIWVLPRAFPHKGFEGASFEDRKRMLVRLAESEPGFSAALSDGGLYAEIAEEAREFFGEAAEIALLAGRDAVERMATWDYGRPGVFNELVKRHRLLVAARQGEYEPAGHHSDRIIRLEMAADRDEVSSSEVRRRIETGEDWRELVPAAIAGMVRNVYG